MKSVATALGLLAGTVVLVGAAGGNIKLDPVHKSHTRNAPTAAARVVHVVGKDFVFEAPDVIPAGLTEFRFMNEGPSLHHMALLQITDGKTVDDLRAFLAKPGAPPAWLKEVGGPNAPAPGIESNATLDLAPGNYAIICFVDIGGPPHFTKGMVKGLRVVPAKGPAAPVARGDVTATLYDYNFKLSAPVKAGVRTVRVVNAAKQHHEIEVIQLAPGATAAQVLDWMQKMDGPPPGKAIGGVAGLEPGMAESFTADFTAGKYALICFLPDAKDGKPHFMHGMIQEITVQ